MTTPELFSDLAPPIARALVRRGFTELTAVQRAVVDAEHSGRDLRISSQTGSGKTVAIGLALAEHFLDHQDSAVPRVSAPTRERGVPPSGPTAAAARPRALVVVPTRELAAQVRGELAWLLAELPGATVEVVTGGTSVSRERIALARKPLFVVGTPGRILDHVRAGALVCEEIEHVILDEADQMLDMGFKDELDAILENLPEERRSHLVSATFPQAVAALANRFQTNALRLEGTKLGHANPDIEHVAYVIRRSETYAALVNLLLLAGDSRCLLFVNRRVDANELAEKLAADGFGAAPFSGELPQAQRTRTLAAFRSGTLPILVSTDVAARGIDVPEISTVVHVDPPKNPDAYVHRSGRTGRAGRAGRSLLLADAGEARRVSRMLAATRVPVVWQRIPSRDQVAAHLDGLARKSLAARLDELEPTETQKLAAKQLLTERDPIALVAALVELAKPKAAREPMAVEGLDPFVDAGRGRKYDKRQDRDARPPHRAGRDARPARGAREPRGADASGHRFTPFTVSWGEQTGATPARLLSHVCRRGGITSEQIGAIRVFAKSSIVEVAIDVAERVEAAARVPDARDPEITIGRARERDGAAGFERREKPGRGFPAGGGRKHERPRAGGRVDARVGGRTGERAARALESDERQRRRAIPPARRVGTPPGEGRADLRPARPATGSGPAHFDRRPSSKHKFSKRERPHHDRKLRLDAGERPAHARPTGPAAGARSKDRKGRAPKSPGQGRPGPRPPRETR